MCALSYLSIYSVAGPWFSFAMRMGVGSASMVEDALARRGSGGKRRCDSLLPSEAGAGGPPERPLCVPERCCVQGSCIIGRKVFALRAASPSQVTGRPAGSHAPFQAHGREGCAIIRKRSALPLADTSAIGTQGRWRLANFRGALWPF